MTGVAHQESRLPITVRWSFAVLAFALFVAGCALFRPSVSLMEQAERARSPGDHAAVARAYRERAERFRREAAEHAAMADWWSNLAGGQTASTGTGRYEEAQHCRRLAADLSAAAAEAETLAELQDRSARLRLKPD